MTADEMFEKIGYKKVFEDKEILQLYNKEENTYIKLEKEVDIANATQDGKTVYMTFNEILACAKLIKEMGENNDS